VCVFIKPRELVPFLINTVNLDTTSRIKTILKVCNVYDSCSTIEGPEIFIHHPTQVSDEDIT